MTSPQLRVTRYLAQKIGIEFHECEDAIGINSRTSAFAVADGATEAYGARYWARLLVRAWVRNPSGAQVEPFVSMVRTLALRAHSRWSKKALSWYAEEKLRSGSYAAFVGLLLQPNDDNLAWNALCLGDSCLIHLRCGAIIESIPLANPDDFGFRPTLIPSNTIALDQAAEKVAKHSGVALAGDIMLLLSDAVAAWYLSARRLDAPAAQTFLSLLEGERRRDLDIFFDDLRSSGEMRNDDVAVVAIAVG